jgi:hypothetical protein
MIRNPWLWAFVAGALLLTAIRPLLRHLPEPPPVLGPFPDLALVDASGRPFGAERLRGHATVVSVFSGGDASALRPVQRLAAANDRPRDLRFLSVATELGADAPQRLRALAADVAAEPGRWDLVAGEAGSLAGSAGKLVLVDPAGRIRGTYGTDDAGLEEVYARARRILLEPR